MDLTKIKEAIDEFDDWDDEAYGDEREAIEYDNFDDHEAEDGYGRDEFLDGSDEGEALDANGWSDVSADEWWERLQSGDIRDDDEKASDEEADSFLAANESLATLNAKEAKLREALKEVLAAKFRLVK
jgi:hypothetical protein